MFNRIRQWLTTQTVLVLIGGHAQRLLPYLEIIYPQASFVLVIDAPHELPRGKRRREKVRVRLLPLGLGQTAQTLCWTLPANIQAHIQSIGGMSASGGMGQCILMGSQAGKALVASADFQRFVKQELIPELRRLAGGALLEVQFKFVGSVAGGTFSGAELPVADGLASMTRRLTTAITSTEFLVTGALTYEGLGDRIWQNAAAAATDIVAYVTDPNRDPREIRRLRLLELAMCGTDEAIRDAFLAQIEQAAHGVWMEYEQQRTGPNNSLNGRFGNIQTWEVAFGTPLDPQLDIAPVVADAFCRPLDDILGRRPSTESVERLDLDDTRTRLINRTVEEIVATALDDTSEQCLIDLSRPTHRHAVEAWARMTSSSRVRLTDLPIHWSKSAFTTAEIDERLQGQRRLLELLDDEKASLFDRHEAMETDIERAETQFACYHGLLKPEGLFSYVKAAFSSDFSKLSRLTAAAEAIRASADDLAQTEAEQIAVDRSHALIEADYVYLRDKLQRLVARLRGVGPELGNTLPTVAPFPLDERLEHFWEATEGSDEEFLDAIRSSVEFTTLEGLAKVTGACAARPEEIARQIATGDCYVTPGTPWGGLLRADQAKEVHLLPAVDFAVQEIITRAVANVDDKLPIAFVDASPAVVNIVGITMRQVRELSDVLTEPYRNALVEVINSPCPEMFLPDGDGSLQSLGIEINGESITFVPQS